MCGRGLNKSTLFERLDKTSSCNLTEALLGFSATLTHSNGSKGDAYKGGGRYCMKDAYSNHCGTQRD